MNEEECIDGCEPCHQTRLICDGQRPCGNCLEHDHECDIVPGYGSPIIESQSRPVPQSSQSKSRKKVVLACLGCRRSVFSIFSCSDLIQCHIIRDNKKCQDARPCARCVLRREECISVERVAKPVKKRCEACRLHSRKASTIPTTYSKFHFLPTSQQCEDRRPCVGCKEEGIECIDLVRKGGPGYRVKRACTSCRFASFTSTYPPSR